MTHEENIQETNNKHRIVLVHKCTENINTTILIIAHQKSHVNHKPMSQQNDACGQFSAFRLQTRAVKLVSVYQNWFLNKNNCQLTGYLKECEFAGKCVILHFDSWMIYIPYNVYIYESRCINRVRLLHINVESVLNMVRISYDTTLSTDICDITVLTQNKNFYHSLYV